MKTTGWRTRLMESTRGRILDLLRTKEQTVNELAAALGLTDNAVRAHLLSLERDGLAHQSGYAARLQKTARDLCAHRRSRADFPEVVRCPPRSHSHCISRQLSPKELRAAMREVGKRVADNHLLEVKGKSRNKRIEAALRILKDLGGSATFEKSDGKHFIRGNGCPLAAATSRHPEACLIAETLLSEIIGAPGKRVLHSREHPIMPLRDPLSSPSRYDEVARRIVLTIGHSTRPLDEFVALLKAHADNLGCRCPDDSTLAAQPQFNKESLPDSLKKAGLGYVHMSGLGGLRHAKDDSVNVGWRNASFRAMPITCRRRNLRKQIEELIQLAREHRIALMCAEALPWRCHRSLIGDALTVRGIRTEDIMSLTQCRLHTLTPFAHVRGSTVTYPAENSSRAKKKISTGKKERAPRTQ